MTPSDHPLWPKFEECFKRNIADPNNTMKVMFWQFYLAGAHAMRHKILLEKPREVIKREGKDIGLVTSDDTANGPRFRVGDDDEVP